MTNNQKIELINKNLEECLTLEDLKVLVESEIPLRHYIGFEISGKLHIGSGLMSAMKIKDFIEAGIDCNILLADWHTWLNDKLSGDLKVIQEVAVNYFKEALKASLICVGGNPEKVKFVLGSDLYHNNDTYWQTLVDISKNLTLARVVKSSTIMGRKEGENQIFARLIYPPMQVADIFIQGVNLAHAGMDQRKAHVIAREVAGNLRISSLKDSEGKVYKPIALHHHLILGLLKPPTWPIVDKENLREIWSSMKMSKSNPRSAIFVHDSEEEIRGKIKEAFCPEKEIDFNPIINWLEFLIFPLKGKLLVRREEKFGGDVLFKTFPDLKETYAKGELHPVDLKEAVAETLIDILAPARDHFSQVGKKKMVEDLESIMKAS